MSFPPSKRNRPGKTRVPLGIASCTAHAHSNSRCLHLALAACLGLTTVSVHPGLRAADAPIAVKAVELATSRIVEAAGTVETAHSDATTWTVAKPGDALNVGDRIRTGAGSRAAVQFTDRSVIRLGEYSTLQVQPPRHSEQRRFNLLRGLLYFFNRERPADIEFETPISSGAIRGTEFVLEAGDAGATTRLALLDGRVELTAAGQSIELAPGELGTVDAGRPPAKTALLETARVVQWALYYPAVVSLGDLQLDVAERTLLEPALSAYRDGDLLAAADAMRAVPAGGVDRELLRTALDLAVGKLPAPGAPSPLSQNHPVARALSALVAVVRADADFSQGTAPPATASEWLARSYVLQGTIQLDAALAAAARAVELDANSGFALVRRAELEFALEHRRAALATLESAGKLAPRLASAPALHGFILLEENRHAEALAAFDEAIRLDAALGSAWLGRGLALLRLHRRDEALTSFQTAAALEPRRAQFRSLLGKAYSLRGERGLAEKDLRLGRELDAADPTAWFYSALHAWQELRPNAAVADLEQSVERNGNRQLFRSRLALDRDLAVRSANLAALYRDAGLPEAAQRAASRAISDDYANFSTHLFLARSYQALEDPDRIDLRREAARQSEFTVASLLAPAGVGGLSQLALQPEHVEWFDPRPISIGSFTEYRSSGDWLEEASVHGAIDGLSYALDGVIRRRHGEEPGAWLERDDLSLQLKQRVTDSDEAWFQGGITSGRQGDAARRYDPAQATAGFRAADEQFPNLRAGWHHAWSPASHTLLLVGRLQDHFQLEDPEHDALFLRQKAGVPISVSTAPFFQQDLDSNYTLYSAELQHLWQTAQHTLVVGARYQDGSVDSAASLDRTLTGNVVQQQLDSSVTRVGAYAYETWHVVEPLRLVAGLSYDRLTHPVNTELPPLADGEQTRERVSPKAGILYTPWRDGLFRAAFTRSLGGVFFDSNVQLEPSQVAGFLQTYRSVAPESVLGLIPGAEFDAAHVGFDQKFSNGTYAGVEAGWLHSQGDRVGGVLTNSLPLPVPDSPGSTRQDLEFRERNVSAYVVQLLGDGFSAGLRYRLSEAVLAANFPEIPAGTAGLAALEQHERAILQEVGLSLNYQHPAGFFARWESTWLDQQNTGYSPGLAGEDLWQHDVWAGWRFLKRRVEVRAGLLNLTGTDYRLNPLNEHARLPRNRTLVLSLRLEF